VTRICDRTGLALVDGPGASVFRLATTSYGPLNPQLRESGDDVTGWARWDTPGRTVYAVDSRRAAFVESTSWARQERPRSAPAQLSRTAAALGMTTEELAREIDEDWGIGNGMNRGWLPAGWRDARRIYRLSFDPGWWVDISHSNTLMAVSDGMREELYELGVTLGLTLSEVTSDNRRLTTAIAAWLRESVTLDDDTLPTGIRFPSKHGRQEDGAATCWAFWMRQADAGLETTRVKADGGEPFDADDPDFAYALDLHNIEAR